MATSAAVFKSRHTVFCRTVNYLSLILKWGCVLLQDISFSLTQMKCRQVTRNSMSSTRSFYAVWTVHSLFIFFPPPPKKNTQIIFKLFQIFNAPFRRTWAASCAPNVLQPYWLIVLPLDVPDLTTSLLLWGPSGQRWRCLWTFLFSNVPAFATSRLQEIPQQPKVELHGREMADEFCLKMPDFHVTFRYLLHAVNLRNGTDGFTSPPKGGVLRIFSPWKIQLLRSGLNARTWVPKARMLDHRSRCAASYRLRKINSIMIQIFGLQT